MITFYVKGTPVSWQRVKRGWTGKSYVPAKTLKWKNHVSWVAKSHRPKTPFDGPVHMKLFFYLQRPKHIKKTAIFAIGRKDIDNLSKSILDALHGDYYRNDNQIAILEARKMYSDEEGVLIEIGETKVF